MHSTDQFNGGKESKRGLDHALCICLTAAPEQKLIHMRLSLLPRCLIAAVAFAASTLVPRAESLRFTGSDLLRDSLRDHLNARVAERDLRLDYSLRGSRLGLAALREKRADLGLLVLAADDPKPAETLVSAVIGYMTSVIVVPESVSINQLTFAQLAGVFGANEQNNYRRWSEIGVLGTWAPRSISVMALGRRQSLALDLFRHQVLKTPELKPIVAQLDTTEEVQTRLRGEEGGMAILSRPPAPGVGLKALLIAKGANDVAYGPSPENLHTGDYPLRIPVLLVFPAGEGGRLRDVFRALLAEEASPALLDSGITPLPIQARNQLLFALETR